MGAFIGISDIFRNLIFKNTLGRLLLDIETKFINAVPRVGLGAVVIKIASFFFGENQPPKFVDSNNRFLSGIKLFEAKIVNYLLLQLSCVT